MRLEQFLLAKSPPAAQRAAGAIAEGVLSLAEHAERARIVSNDGIRELVVRFGRDGYIVQYRVDESLVLVTRIFHGKERR